MSTIPFWSWSFSSLSMYESCPKKYEIIRVKKVISDIPGKAAEEGTRIHTMIENYLMHDTWDDELLKWKTLLQIVKDKHGQCEVGYHFKKGMARCEAKDPECWIRSYIDWIKVEGETAELIDWKTGRVKHTKQLAFYAWLVFQAHPEVQQVKGTFHWINHNDHISEWFYRKDLNKLFDPLDEIIQQINISRSNDIWPESGNGCKWCPVTKEHCSRGK